MNILSYGGGRQTAALCELIRQERYPRPDRIVIADTGREKQSTWDYLEEIMQPRMAAIGLPIEIAPRSLAYVDLYAHNGDLLVPVYTKTGKLPAFCSNEWKQRVVQRYIKEPYTAWIGFAFDERKRVKSETNRTYPLIDLMLSKADCLQVLEDAGMPVPPPSSCWMCPNMRDAEWLQIQREYPADFQRAIDLDVELRTEDIDRGGSGVWLHHSRQPLGDVIFDVADDSRHAARQCALGMCFV